MDTRLHHLYEEFPDTTHKMVEEAVSRLTLYEKKIIYASFRQGRKPKDWQRVGEVEEKNHGPVNLESFIEVRDDVMRRITTHITQRSKEGRGKNKKKDDAGPCKHSYPKKDGYDAVCKKCGTPLLKDPVSLARYELKRRQENGKFKTLADVKVVVREAEGSRRTKEVNAKKVEKRRIPENLLEEFKLVCGSIEGGQIIFLFHNGLNYNEIMEKLDLKDDRMRNLRREAANQILLREDLSEELQVWVNAMIIVRK